MAASASATDGNSARVHSRRKKKVVLAFTFLLLPEVERRDEKLPAEFDKAGSHRLSHC